MPDSSDFDVDAVRWGITTALVQAANAYNPTSAAKDAGAVAGQAIDPGAENQRAGHLYTLARFLVNDVLPQFFPWDGLLPGQSAGYASINGASIDVAQRRWWLDSGTLMTVSAASLAVTANATGSTRLDDVVVEIDTDGTGTYLIVTGTTSRPSLSSEQYAIATFEVANGGSTPTNLVEVAFHPVQRPRPRTRALTIPACAFNVPEPGGATYSQLTSGMFQPLGSSVGYVLVAPLNLPHGAQVQSITLAFNNAGTSVNVSAVALRSTVVGNTANSEWASVGSTAVNTTNVSLSFVGVDNEEIDNDQYAYSLQVSFTAAAVTPQNLSFRGARVVFEEPS